MCATKNDHLTTEEAILAAARRVFVAKGLAGARMQDIANDAGINKALVHYYYRSKERLFERVFREELNRMHTNMSAILGADIPLFEKITRVIERDIEWLLEFPQLPLFILNEMSHNTDENFDPIRQMRTHKALFYETFAAQVQREVAQGNIRPISPEQLMMHIISMTMFPFIAAPIFKIIMDKTDDEYRNMMLARKREITQTLLAALKP